jgi:hypothetical protein
MFGIREVMARNFANSADDQARSKYLPPWYMVRPAIASVKMLFSTSVVVRKVHG